MQLRSVSALLAVLVAACGESSSQDNDPLRDADVVSCDMPLDHACIQYERVRSASSSGFVLLEEARAVCRQGWPGGSPAAGTFGEGPCSTESALARCIIPRGYVEVHYYNAGFGDAGSEEDLSVALGMLCSRSLGTLQKPPF